MYCVKCGASIAADFDYCGSCGAANTHRKNALGAFANRLPMPGSTAPTSPPTPMNVSPYERAEQATADAGYAGFARRGAAWLLDQFFVGLLAIVPAIIAGVALNYIAAAVQSEAFTALERERRQENTDAAVGFAIIGAWIVTWLVYHVVSAALGASWGKRAVGIRIVRAGTRSAPGIGKALIRTMVPVLMCVTLLGIVLVVLDYLSMLWDHDKQTWHDKAADTVVVHHVDEGQLAGAANVVAA